MLSYLKIENLAIVPSLSVEFGPGFNVLTGETGAGKSIIVDAVTLLLGGRGSAEMIRTGAEKLTVEALFELPGRRHPLAARLAEMGFEAGEEGLILKREYTSAGRSRAFVNGSLATLAQLRELGEELADVHGQSPHQSLLHSRGQREVLDQFCGASELAAETAAAAQHLKRLLKERAELLARDQEQARLVSSLQSEIEEIEGASLQPGEEEDLRRQEAILRHAEEIGTLAGEVNDLLYEADVSAVALAGSARGRLERLARIVPECSEGLEAVNAAVASLNDAARSIQPFLEQEEYDPARLEQIGARLAGLERLKKKYGASVEEVIAYLESAREKLALIEGSADRLESLALQIEETGADYEKLAAELSRKRRAGAGRLRTAVRNELKSLAMGGARFEVDLQPHGGAGGSGDDEFPAGGEPAAARPHGAERIEFLLSPNPGEAPKPLARIASGGELSRVMLALRTAANAGDNFRSLVFDEVDAGIGGVVADAVARRLKGLSGKSQVLCVTHLPQVAARADIHLRVEKSTASGRTRSQVSRLDREERVEELARMLGSPKAPTARKHARALIDGRKGP